MSLCHAPLEFSLAPESKPRTQYNVCVFVCVPSPYFCPSILQGLITCCVRLAIPFLVNHLTTRSLSSLPQPGFSRAQASTVPWNPRIRSPTNSANPKPANAAF